MLWFGLRVEAKYYAYYFTPISIVSRCIKQPNVSCEMARVIVADARGLRWRIEKGWGHGINIPARKATSNGRSLTPVDVGNPNLILLLTWQIRCHLGKCPFSSAIVIDV
jgi:hypothetical protein